MKIIKKLILALLIFALGWMLGASLTNRPDRIEYRLAKIGEQMDEIRCLNLINSLYLSSTQRKQLIFLARQAQHSRDETLNVFRRNEAALCNLLPLIHKQVKNTPHLSKNTDQQFRKIESALANARFKEDQKLHQILAQVKQVLNDNQKFLVKNYSPCIMPSCDMDNPERVGQAENREIELHYIDQKLLGKTRNYYTPPKAGVAQEGKAPRFTSQWVKNNRFSYKNYDERKILKGIELSPNISGLELELEAYKGDKLSINIINFILSSPGLKVVQSYGSP